MSREWDTLNLPSFYVNLEDTRREAKKKRSKKRGKQRNFTNLKNEHMPIELESHLIYNPFDEQAKKN
jgi:hypothetical protein